jgi:hypothetical protein
LPADLRAGRLARVERLSLASSVVRSAGYDANSQTLELEFVSGRVYRYAGVPIGTYAWLLRAPSKGAFVTRMITDRYAYQDVTPAPADQDLDAALRASLREVEGRKPG